jgi:hypothetical protein
MRHQQILEAIDNFWVQPNHPDHTQQLAARRRHARHIWDMLQAAYESMGGFKSAADVQELVQEPGLWKVFRRGHNIIAVVIYKDTTAGRKLIGAASDGTREGKAALRRINKDDTDFGRSWSEVSGRMETWLQELGQQPVPYEQAKELLKGKHITPADPDDGFHYIREIQGKPITKIVMGNPRYW